MSSSKFMKTTAVKETTAESSAAITDAPVPGNDPEYAKRPRILLTISARPTDQMRAEIAAGKQPRRDYDVLLQILGADVIYFADAQKEKLSGLVRRLFGSYSTLTWAAFRRRRQYDTLFTDTEIVGLPLALLLKLTFSRAGHPRYVTLAHGLTSRPKRLFFRLSSSRIDTLIMHCAAQRALATSVMHVPEERVLKLPYFVDVDFWKPLPPEAIAPSNEQRPVICAAGLEWRDYPTMLRAVDGLDVDVRIAAASAPNLRNRILADLPDAPSNVSVSNYDYAGMRQLYSTSRFVVVPLVEQAAPAGVSVILEAMAMSKAVIASGTRGQTDVLRDPRNDGRGLVQREWWPSFLETSELADTVGCLPTGFYVTPGNPDELRERIQYLLDHPEVADELGRNGRRVVEAYFHLDAFARRFAAAILGNPQV